MKRRDKIGAPVRCCCVNEAETDEHTDLAHMHIREKMMESVHMLKRALGRTAHWAKSIRWMLFRGILVVVLFVAMLLIGTHAPRTDVGLVENKYITCMSDGKVHVLMLNADGKADTIAQESENDMGFRGKGLVVDSIMENGSMQSYNDLEYRVSMRSPETGRSDTYIVSRAIFNTLDIGSTVSFEIDMPHNDRIRRLITKDMNLKAHDPYFPEMQTVRQYMHE